MRRVSAIAAAIFAVIASVMACCAPMADAAPQDPPVPPGRDPGGRAVALIGSGINYTQDGLAQMLARDGEGEIIGYDFVDDDRRPYSATGSTDAAALLMAEGQAATLVVLRANAADAVSLAKAIGYAAQSPARIIAIAVRWPNAEALEILKAASARFPKHLFVVAAPDQTAPDVRSSLEKGLGNVLVVTMAMAASGPDGGPPADGGDPAVMADVAISVDPSRPGDPAMAAIARAAALAARRQAVEPGEGGAALKQSLVNLATPADSFVPAKTRFGWIAKPQRHYWLE